MDSAQARPRSQVASSTPSCLRNNSLAGGSSISQATTRSTVGSPTDKPPKSRTAARASRSAPTGSPPPDLRGTTGATHGQLLRAASWLRPINAPRRRGRNRSPPSDRQRSMFSRVAWSIVAIGSPRYDRRSGSLTASAGTSARLRAARTAARSFARFFASRVDGGLRIDHLRVFTIDPADHRPAFGIVAVGLEHGNHLRHGNRQRWCQHREPGRLFRDGRRSSRLARQSHEELVPEAEQRVRRAARCQAAHRRVSVIRHHPAHQVRTNSMSIGISSECRARATPGLNPTVRSLRNRLSDALSPRKVDVSVTSASVPLLLGTSRSTSIDHGSPSTSMAALIAHPDLGGR